MASTKTNIQETQNAANTIEMRRKVISSLVLGAGTMALAACGGGDLGSVSDAVSRQQKDAAASGTDVPNSVAEAASTTGGSPGTGNTSMTGVVLDTSFGVKGDNLTNDRMALQRAIDGSVGQILLITGMSRIDAKGLDLRSNSHIRFAKGAYIKFLPHNTHDYQIMRMWDITNVNLEAPYLDGSKEVNRAGSGEWGMGISIAGSSNITITNPTTVGCWGDGIYIQNSYSGNNAVSRNIKISGHHASNCRRQGMSIISVSGITITNPIWENIKGTSPSCGLDIEPDNDAALLENIVVTNPITRNNAGCGISIDLGNLPSSTPKKVNISITGHNNSKCLGNFSVFDLHLNGCVVTGAITSTNPVWDMPMSYGYANVDWDSAGPKVSVINPTITGS
jgi:hypothetical protein